MFKNHLFNTHRYDLFDQCVVNLDVTGFDLTDFLDSCWRYKLYDSMFYLSVYGREDCITPIKILLNELEHQNLSNIQLGNAILKNICSLLVDRNIKHFKQVMNFLINKYDSDDQRAAWRYLKIIIHFDFKDFLNVLTLVFERINDIRDPIEKEAIISRRDKLLYILLQIIFSEKKLFDSDSAAFFVFLAHQMTLKQPSGILMNKIMLDQTIEILTANENSFALEKQQALLGLLESKILGDDTIDKILDLSEKLNLYT
ncbi:Vacuolar protein sorting-associated protein 8 [Thelohanellus kitauei]|uniref:Vacuolar protein sorting-associated protein 8 n=1 Tax=Thelohanellus kitauei TaxID=669202 RepID=A0A0C2MDJ5_THEKT|nr:Vacuolar protein sorting-associated protein 8 [Thelohanellus kitauei]